jgi:MFS family permease
MTAAATTRERPPWGLVVLLVAAMIISFFDRGNLAVAAPVLAPEMGLSTWALGLLLSAFFWTYAVSQIGAGWLVDRIEVRSCSGHWPRSPRAWSRLSADCSRCGCC